MSPITRPAAFGGTGAGETPAVRIGLLGAKGRMGQEVATLLASDGYKGRAELAASIDQGDALDALLKTDVIIDFSAPEAATALIDLLGKSQPDTTLPALVVGSTGWSLDGRAALRKIAERTPLVLSANFSTGVQLMIEMLKEYGPLFDKFGYTPVIVETHHTRKKDSPSGTALSLQRSVSPAGPGNVQTHAIRIGEVVGDHTVTYHGKADQISIAHHAGDRSIFARGAIDVAIWLASRRTGDKALRGMLGMDAYFKELRS